MSTTSHDTTGAAADAPVLNLEIQGMSCGHCVAAVRSALANVPGVGNAHVAVGSARIALDPEAGAPRDVAAAAIDAIRDAGYDARPADAPSGDASDTVPAPARAGGLPVMGSCCGSR